MEEYIVAVNRETQYPHNYLLVVIDRLTLQVHLIPTDTRVTAKGIAWLFLKEVVRLHGIPDSIVSD